MLRESRLDRVLENSRKASACALAHGLLSLRADRPSHRQQKRHSDVMTGDSTRQQETRRLARLPRKKTTENRRTGVLHPKAKGSHCYLPCLLLDHGSLSTKFKYPPPICAFLGSQSSPAYHRRLASPCLWSRRNQQQAKADLHAPPRHHYFLPSLLNQETIKESQNNENIRSPGSTCSSGHLLLHI